MSRNVKINNLMSVFLTGQLLKMEVMNHLVKYIQYNRSKTNCRY